MPPLAATGLAAIVGIVLADCGWYRGSVWLWLMGFVVALGLFWKWNRGAALLLFAVAAYGLLHSTTLTRLEQVPMFSAMKAGQRFDVTAVGIVADAPRAMPSGIEFPIKLSEIRRAGDRYGCGASVVVVLKSDAKRIPAYGDIVRVTGTLNIPATPDNPGQFDYADFMGRRGISAELFVGSRGNVAITASDQGNPIKHAALRCRDWIGRAITRGIEDAPRAGSIIRAMVLGTRDETPKDIEEAFVDSGTMHVFAVSGLHVGIFAFIAWTFLRTLQLRRHHAILLIIPCILFYAFVTGLRPSAFRAAVMMTIVLSGFLFDRRPGLTNNLGAAGLLILAVDTNQLFSPGFQLSFCVLLCIVAFAGLFQRPFRHFTAPDPFLPKALVTTRQSVFFGFGKKVVGLLSVSIAAWLGSAPLMLLHFEMATPIAVIANCFLVPFALTLLFTASLSLLATVAKASWLAVVFNNANWAFAKCCLWFAALFASVPGAKLDWRPEARAFDDRAEVTVLSIPDGGGAVHLRLPGNADWFLDSGDGWIYGRAVVPYMRFRNVETTMGVIVSHGDSSHIGGASKMVRRLKPVRVIQTKSDNRSPASVALSRELEASEITPEVVFAGAEIEMGQGGSLKVLYPPDDSERGRVADDACLVMRFDFDGWRILICNDAGFSAEKWLLANVSAEELRSDIMVKGRHASDFSGLLEFIDVVQPRAIVSTNYHFPEGERIPPDWRVALDERQIQLFDQSQSGAVTITLDPDELEVDAFRSGQSMEVGR